MRKKLNITESIFPMPVLMVATYNEDGSGVIGKAVNVTADENVMVNSKVDMSLVNAIALWCWSECCRPLFLLNGKKTEHRDFQFLYALTPLLYLFLIDMIDYANCIV